MHTKHAGLVASLRKHADAGLERLEEGLQLDNIRSVQQGGPWWGMAHTTLAPGGAGGKGTVGTIAERETSSLLAPPLGCIVGTVRDLAWAKDQESRSP
jgi:hypothetical protein